MNRRLFLQAIGIGAAGGLSLPVLASGVTYSPIVYTPETWMEAHGAPKTLDEFHRGLKTLFTYVTKFPMGATVVHKGDKYEHITYALKTKATSKQADEDLIGVMWDVFSNKWYELEYSGKPKLIYWRRMPELGYDHIDFGMNSEYKKITLRCTVPHCPTSRKSPLEKREGDTITEFIRGKGFTYRGDLT